MDSPKGSEKTKSDDEFEVSNESYVVTRYARPRGFVSMRDQREQLKSSIVNPRLMSEKVKDWNTRYTK